MDNKLEGYHKGFHYRIRLVENKYFIGLMLSKSNREEDKDYSGNIDIVFKITKKATEYKHRTDICPSFVPKGIVLNGLQGKYEYNHCFTFHKKDNEDIICGDIDYIEYKDIKLTVINLIDRLIEKCLSYNGVR